MLRARYAASDAPIKIPSSTNTNPLSGWKAATKTKIPATPASTAGSVVKMRGRRARPAQNAAPKTTPIPTPHTSIRRPTCSARAASPIPRYRPVSTCPAMAMESSSMARNIHSSMATWCAATVAVPMRAATDVDRKNTP